MPVVSNPRVRFAIARAIRKQWRKRMRQDVARALERAGAASLKELVELTGFDARECGAAIDSLRILGRVVEEPEGVFQWIAGADDGLSGRK